MAPHSNTDTQSRAHVQFTVAIVFLTLAWISVTLRLYVRIIQIKSFGWDDVTMILAVILFSVFCTALLVVHAHGGGTHVKSLSQIENVIDWIIVSEASYIMTTMFLKVSLGIFMLRIVIKRWHQWSLYIVIALSTLTSLFFFFFVIFMCGNPNTYFTKYMSYQCAPHDVQVALSYTHAAITTASDCFFALLPIAVLWNAPTMNTRSKLSVGLILSLGAAGSICSVIRFRYIEGLTNHTDFFWNAANIAIWSCIEPGTGIVAANLATLRPLIVYTWRRASTITFHTSPSLTRARTRSPGPSPAAPQGQKRFLRPWEDTSDASRTTMTCVGGRDAEAADLLRSAAGTEKSRTDSVGGHPTGSDFHPTMQPSREGGISKVVAVDVNSERRPDDTGTNPKP